MARVVKEKEYAVRLNEILDSAQRLVYTKGYEQMSIQDILDDLKISKGAFYHYFNSKQALLEALVARMEQDAGKILVPVVQDPQLPALEKLECFFDSIARWKSAQKTYLLGLLSVWYADYNAIVRQKLVAGGIKWITPMLTEIIHQGVQEGVMNTPNPEQVGEVVVTLMVSLGDSIGGKILSIGQDCDEQERSECLHQMENSVAVYTNAIERVLGAPPGSLMLFDPAALKEWVVPPNGARQEKD